ncbi:MAG TPA: crotonase/enoyl-CoA hydratase family protein [Acidimicrobiaceae bacterium]|nr:enoyl-CoA hydratase [Acidimicrobiaceae bacterium]MDP7258317.1 crotonase/enoyl-CoA hydratase family protein [Acidimicrobiales bacterium]HCV35381.1 crotonase/enoyl-CoA hydratase family protein [Acidimicrobiaceae bacterium]HJO79697.1 crotonase/enoyl-CoA hydratase family protein [Acidimicrobiales bacterium]
MNDTPSTPQRAATVRMDGSVAVIDFDDGKANALGHESISSLMLALDWVEQEGADAVVVAGRPGRFSAGFDMNVMNAGPDEAREMLRRGVDLFLRCYLFPRPVIAACTGHAIAAGAIILLSCDLRIGSRGEFRIGLPEVTIGMGLPFFATELARDRISKRHLTRATALGTMYGPEEALDSGFLDEVTDPNDVVSTAVERAQGLTEISRSGLLLTRKTARGAIAESIRSGLDEDLSRFSVGS